MGVREDLLRDFVDDLFALIERSATRQLSFADRNRRIIAERTGWPAGALRTCENLDRLHRPWDFFWSAEVKIKGWERPAGWIATQHDVSLPGGDTLRRHAEDRVARHPCVFGKTVAEVEAAVAEMDERITAYQLYLERFSGWLRGVGG